MMNEKYKKITFGFNFIGCDNGGFNKWGLIFNKHIFAHKYFKVSTLIYNTIRNQTWAEVIHASLIWNIKNILPQ